METFIASKMNQHPTSLFDPRWKAAHSLLKNGGQLINKPQLESYHQASQFVEQRNAQIKNPKHHYQAYPFQDYDGDNIPDVVVAQNGKINSWNGYMVNENDIPVKAAWYAQNPETPYNPKSMGYQYDPDIAIRSNKKGITSQFTYMNEHDYSLAQYPKLEKKATATVKPKYITLRAYITKLASIALRGWKNFYRQAAGFNTNDIISLNPRFKTMYKVFVDAQFEHAFRYFTGLVNERMLEQVPNNQVYDYYWGNTDAKEKKRVMSIVNKVFVDAVNEGVVQTDQIDATVSKKMYKLLFDDGGIIMPSDRSELPALQNQYVNMLGGFDEPELEEPELEPYIDPDE
jgi:hypothetical protein